MRETMLDLDYRINEPEHYAASGKLTRRILNQVNERSPMTIPAETFNQATEKYYRTRLRTQHIEESFNLLTEDIIKLELAESGISQEMRSLLHSILQEKNLPSFMETAQSEVIAEKAVPATLEKIVSLILVYIHYKKNLFSKF